VAPDNHDPNTAEAAYELRGRVDKDPDLGVPTVDDVLDRYGHMPMTIEVKDEQAAEGLVSVLRAKSIPFENLIVTSFSDTVVDRLHHLAPDLPLAPGGRWTFGFYLRTRLPSALAAVATRSVRGAPGAAPATAE
jgi:glycerophosphoryl diester phosphodiesterase